MSDTIDTQENTIHFERQLDASPEDVFDAWTQPEQVTKWWDPTGVELAACSIDLRPEGSFRFETAEHARPFEGTYRIVERPSRLEFDAMGAHGTVLFHSRGAGTLMKVSIRCASREHFELFLKLGVQTGTSITLDNLVRHVKTARTSPHADLQIG